MRGATGSKFCAATCAYSSFSGGSSLWLGKKAKGENSRLKFRPFKRVYFVGARDFGERVLVKIKLFIQLLNPLPIHLPQYGNHKTQPVTKKPSCNGSLVLVSGSTAQKPKHM